MYFHRPHAQVFNPKIAKHGKEVHGLSDEELTDPKMVEMIKSLIKEE